MGGFKEWVDEWVAKVDNVFLLYTCINQKIILLCWWMGGLQKLITVSGRFDTYKGGGSIGF